MADDSYPRLYALIGDKIYENAQGLRVLSKSENFIDEKSEIEEFISKSENLKELGYRLDRENSSTMRSKYIHRLRLLEQIDDEIMSKILLRLEILFKDKNYKYLASLYENRSFDIRESYVVKTAYSLTQKQSDVSKELIDFTKLQNTFNNYKSQLLKAREDENASECLNDITALYHYFVELELSVQQNNCSEFDDLYKQMSVYLNEIGLTCKDDSKLIMEANMIVKRYEKSSCNF
jgi:hypothetical protein